MSFMPRTALFALAAATSVAAAQPAPAPRGIRTGEQNPFYDYSPMPSRAKRLSARSRSSC